jgi:transcriptional antiterminator RfaH
MGEACLQLETNVPAFRPSASSDTNPSAHLNWYTLKVRTGAEMKAVEALQHRGFAPYCPMHFERRQYSDRMKVVQVAAFQGYVFCQFDVQNKLPIISTRGVEYIVGFADGPTPVPEKEIADVQRMMEAGASAVLSIPLGGRVRVTHGPLEGVEGVLVRDNNGYRLVVSIELLRQGASLHINQDQVSQVGRN